MYNFDKINDPRLEKRARDHMGLDQICNEYSEISYDILELSEMRQDVSFVQYKKWGNNPPRKYLINFKLTTIVSINKDNSPNFGDWHQCEIELPRHYPEEPPKFMMKTEIWHPNIRRENPSAGKICSNSDFISSFLSISELVLRLKEILEYKRYYVEDSPPFPEEPEIAKWVKEHAEPNDIVRIGEGINLAMASIRKNKTQKEYKKKLAGGKIKETINSLLEDEKYNQHQNELYMHLANYNKLATDARASLISKSEEMFYFKSMIMALLKLIDETESRIY